MLKITKKVEYALIAIKHLSENPKKLSSVADMSTTYGIPREILAKTMQALAKENIVESVKGPQGGYRNKNKTSDVSLNKFFEANRIFEKEIFNNLDKSFNLISFSFSQYILFSKITFLIPFLIARFANNLPTSEEEPQLEESLFESALSSLSIVEAEHIVC